MRAAGVVGWRVVRARLAAAPHPAVPPGTNQCQQIKQICGEQNLTAEHLHAPLPPCELTSQPRLDDVRWSEGGRVPGCSKGGMCPFLKAELCKRMVLANIGCTL